MLDRNKGNARASFSSALSRRLLVAVLTVLSVGCGAGVEDVSDREPYSSIVGTEYRVVGDVDGYGITEDPGSGMANYVALRGVPGVAGREVVFKKRIPKGTTFRILAVRRRFRPFDKNLEYVVQLDYAELPKQLEVSIDLIGSNEGVGSQLNETAYERVTR